MTATDLATRADRGKAIAECVGGKVGHRVTTANRPTEPAHASV